MTLFDRLLLAILVLAFIWEITVPVLRRRPVFPLTRKTVAIFTTFFRRKQ